MLQQIWSLHQERCCSRYWETVALLRKIDWRIHSRRDRVVIFIVIIYIFVVHIFFMTLLSISINVNNNI